MEEHSVSKSWAMKSDEEKQAIVRKRAKKCDPDCNCGRHSQSVKDAVSRANKGRRWSMELTDEQREQKSQSLKEMWARKTPEELAEISRKKSESLKKYWESRDQAQVKVLGWGSSSNHEVVLAPYLEALGYVHNRDMTLSVGRKKPDFVDLKNRRVFEYFGTHWHPEPSEEQSLVDYYNKIGWTCVVLWEDNLYEWLLEHRTIVTKEEHEAAWSAAMTNNGYRVPPTHTTVV